MNSLVFKRRAVMSPSKSTGAARSSANKQAQSGNLSTV
jgi:hypothetical protein